MKRYIYILTILIFLIFINIPYISSENNVDYLIIYGGKNIDDVSSFKEYKENEGYKVKVVTVKEIDESVIGKDRGEKIRNFLKINKDIWKFNYVLLIGSYTSIPQIKFYPLANTRDNDNEIIPSDYYYANLSCDFDSDKDKTIGEYGEDEFPYFVDVFVGRLLFTDKVGIDKYVENLKKYNENKNKSRALLMASMLWFKNEYGDYPKENSDGALTTETLKRGVLNNLNFETTSMYEKQGDAVSKFQSTYPLNLVNVEKEINNNYSFIGFFGHGDSGGVYRRIWNDKNSNNKFDKEEDSWETFLNRGVVEKYGISNAVIYAMGCLTAETEVPNLAMTTLRNGAVGYIGATRVAYGDPNFPISKELLYWGDRYFNNGETLGESLYLSKFDLSYSISSFYDQHNFFVFNLFGDPSISYYDESYSIYPRNFTIKQKESQVIYINKIRGDVGEIEINSNLPYEILSSGLKNNFLINIKTGYKTKVGDYYININIGEHYSTIIKVNVEENCLPYDLNDDGLVNINDFIIFSKSFNLKRGDINFNERCDFNDDDVVNILDFIIFAKNYNS
ncbi:MAG TPA: C25 family cysteine peptidase [Caldisericia bacterium]|nr:C25 family cysteine peptidase [Caldisericia bacterium]HPC57224.1 C25 family cysteine peptidase [Caldisericia bacterium]